MPNLCEIKLVATEPGSAQVGRGTYPGILAKRIFVSTRENEMKIAV
jgi:hypothetical protein